MQNETFQAVPPVQAQPRQMQQLQLANDLFVQVVNGSKYHTIREGRRDIQLGMLELYSTGKVTGGDHLRHAVRVHRVVYTKVGGLCDHEAKEFGYKNVEDLIDKLHRHYSTFNDNCEITIIYWS